MAQDRDKLFEKIYFMWKGEVRDQGFLQFAQNLKALC